MPKKNIIITILITLISGVILLLSSMSEQVFTRAYQKYQVYLHGEIIGVIDNENDLYNLIDQSQTSIKDEYNVTNVYPPNDLKIVAINTYNNTSNKIDEVYNKIEEVDDFTIRGYIITIKGEDTSFTINVLDEEIFHEALVNFVNSFLDDGVYEDYINDTQEEIVDTGSIIENMYFEENITIKEAYISVNEKIYTDENELTQYLLFGEDPDMEYYTVKLGDTIESIADEYNLGTSDLLTINPELRSEDVILRVGSTLNVTYINPVLNFVYDLHRVSVQEIAYDIVEEKDSSKYTSYEEVKTPGQKGEELVTEKFTVTNGVQAQGSEIVNSETIKEPVNQVVVVGTRRPSGGGGNLYPPVSTGTWGWPTARPYVITSYFASRWGTHHDGIDISGTGHGSPIYAIGSGTVVYVYNGCPAVGSGLGDTCGGSLGNYVVIDHGNNMYGLYAHNARNNVSVGQTVSRGEVIATMGSSGRATGTHLHFAISYGYPYRSGSYFGNPMNLY